MGGGVCRCRYMLSLFEGEDGSLVAEVRLCWGAWADIVSGSDGGYEYGGEWLRTSMERGGGRGFVQEYAMKVRQMFNGW